MKRVLAVSMILVFVSAACVFSQNQPPLIPNIKSVEIVDCIFVDQYQCERYKVTVNPPYRAVILTLKIEKEAGEMLKFALADLTLHYYHGEDGSSEEVAPCDAISTFSTVLDVDRTLKTSKCAPGWIKRDTGTRTSASSMVYVDVAFRQIEHNISKMWLCIASPVASTTTDGFDLTAEDRKALEENE